MAESEEKTATVEALRRTTAGYAGWFTRLIKSVDPLIQYATDKQSSRLPLSSRRNSPKYAKRKIKRLRGITKD